MRYRRFVNDVLDALGAGDPQFRRDAGEGVMFARELENVRSRIYDVPIAQFKGRLLVPVDHSVNPGAESDTYTWYDRVAAAEYVRDFSTQPPRVDVFGGQVTHGIRHVWLSYAWNVQELRAAAMAQKSLPTMKASACREGIEAIIDESLLIGNTLHNLKGLFTLTGTNTYTPPNGIGGSPTWALKTPREILNDLYAMERKVYVDSLEIETIDTLVLATDLFGIIATRPMGDGDNVTILRRFLADAQYVKSVETSPRLATAGSGSTTRTVGYRKSPDVLQGIIPLEFTQQAPQWTGLEARTIAEARVGGVQLYRPKAVIYGDGM